MFFNLFTYIHFYLLTVFQVAQLGSSLSPYYQSFIIPCDCSITYPSLLHDLAQMAFLKLLCEDHLQQTLKLLTWRQGEISLNLSFKSTLQLLLFPTP